MCFNFFTTHLLSRHFRYIEAIRKLKKENKNFKRTIHLTFMPGEIVRFIFYMFQNMILSYEYFVLLVTYRIARDVY